jgi:2-amino-4-hydroxy-6-hydroxymethyldihydropteridine diphosphokinase
MLIVFLLLGSNLGDRRAYLKRAIGFIEKEIALVTMFSSVFETQAWGKTDTSDYLNQVIALESDLPAQIILKKILAIEKKLGRIREEKWGSRTIDIDILFYGDEIINADDLIIPHSELHKRRFTLEPLAEITPEFIHPILKKSILTLKNELNDNLIVKKL